MLYVEKGREPRELTRARKDPTVDSYDSLRDDVLTPVRRSLMREQGQLCVYCMRRIHGAWEAKSSPNLVMHIEHYLPCDHGGGARVGTMRDGRPYDMREYGLRYSNMFAVCKGSASDAARHHRRRVLTCDASKGSQLIAVDPLDRNSVGRIAYRMDGTVYSEDADMQHDLNVTLNLNCRELSLPANRKSARDALVRKLGEKRRDVERKLYGTSRKGTHASRRSLRKVMCAYYAHVRRELTAGERWPEYVGIMRYELDRRIAKAQKG